MMTPHDHGNNNNGSRYGATINLPPLVTDLPVPSGQDDFQKALQKEESLATFAAMNKIRESLLIGMGRAAQSGGDLSPFIKALQEIRTETQLSQDRLDKFLP